MRKNWDLLTLFVIFGLGSISLLVIFSISKNLATNQFIYWLMGLLALLIASQLPSGLWQRISLPFYLFVLSLLLLLFLIGDPVRGSVRWIEFGPFRFQPSELAKVSSIFLLASFYSQRSAKVLKNLIRSFLIVFPAAILIFLEPDLGNAVSIIAIWFGISFASGFKLKSIAIFALLILSLGILGFELLPAYQKDRVETFINPSKDALGTGYNIIQSKIAIGSGQLFGRGLGRGTQSQLNFLPEAESDFIFASITEQLGLLGATLVVIFSQTLILRIINFSQNLEKFSQLLVIGTASFLMFQSVVNIGMNLALLPVTGITLPLVSYGGSSLISTLFLLGIVFSTRRNQY